MARVEGPLKRTVGGALLLLGAVALLLGVCLIIAGFGGLIFGMHGGAVSAGITAILGVGPAYLGYSLVRTGLRLLRGTNKGHATSSPA